MNGMIRLLAIPPEGAPEVAARTESRGRSSSDWSLSPCPSAEEERRGGICVIQKCGCPLLPVVPFLPSTKVADLRNDASGWLVLSGCVIGVNSRDKRDSWPEFD